MDFLLKVIEDRYKDIEKRVDFSSGPHEKSEESKRWRNQAF